jgi:hypothetical protein
MRLQRKATVVLGAVAVALAAAVPAQSTVRERSQVKDEPYSFTTDECGFPIAVEGSFSDLAIVREGNREDDGAFPVVDHFGFSETYTNVDTGEWFTITGKATFVEIRATRVDGPIFEFRFVEAGQPFVVRDSEGNVVARNRGAVHATYLFDTGGDDEPGGEEVPDTFEVIRIAGPHPSFEAEFCEIASDLIG